MAGALLQEARRSGGINVVLQISWPSVIAGAREFPGRQSKRPEPPNPRTRDPRTRGPRQSSQAVNRLFALAIFLSATLLFIVQPLSGKILLPVLGGSPAVWSACLVFFQAVLLLGYLYAHALTTRVPQRWQWPVHVGVLIVAGTMLPLPIEIGEPGGADPRWWVLRTLAGTVGLPFFALSATAPLLQHWFSRTTNPGARDPYFLYAASNAGSLLGLLAYLLVEPVATRSTQVTGWAMAFWGFAALVAACAYASVRYVDPAASLSASPAKAKPDATRLIRRCHNGRCGSSWRWCRRPCCSASRNTSPPTSCRPRCSGWCRWRSTCRPSWRHFRPGASEARGGGGQWRRSSRCSSWSSRWRRYATRCCRSRWYISRRSRRWRCCATPASPRAVRMPRT